MEQTKINISNTNKITKNNSKKNQYKEGFFTKLNTEDLPNGLSENVVRAISKKRNEPDWMLEFRINAYKSWLNMDEPHWLKAHYDKLNYNDYSYYSSPCCNDFKSKTNSQKKSAKKIKKNYLTSEVKNTFNQLGIPLNEDSEVAVDAIFDSVSVYTTYREKLAKKGIIFCSFNEAVHDYPDLVRKYLGTVVPGNDNFFAALNAAVASDGTFVYIQKGVHCPMELSTYFRINAAKTGQFERTIIVADEESYVSYIEGCSAPVRDTYQLHAAVVEVIILKNAKVKYSTVQNWFSGNESGKGGILNFVTKRALCDGENSKMSWTQSETGSAITWKYPSVILRGNNSIGEFFSVALTNGKQKADTGTKMIHIGKNTRSTIISKGISADKSENTYRGLVKIMPTAINSRNFTQCDSMLIGSECGAHTFPYVEVCNNSAQIEHEASTSRIGEEQLFYCRQRGIGEDNAISMIVNGFCKDVFSKLPLEFAVEAQKLLAYRLEHSVG